MRKIININNDWAFYKNTNIEGARENPEMINLPHSWNAIDGQDGGNEYFRGTCLYVKNIKKEAKGRLWPSFHFFLWKNLRFPLKILAFLRFFMI